MGCRWGSLESRDWDGVKSAEAFCKRVTPGRRRSSDTLKTWQYGPAGSSRADRCWRSACKGLDLGCWLRATSWTVWPLVPLPCSVLNWGLLRGEQECHLNAKGNPEEANSWNLSGNHLPPPGQQVLSWGGVEHHISRSAMVHPLCHTDLLLHDIWKQLLMAQMGLASRWETWIEGG